MIKGTNYGVTLYVFRGRRLHCFLPKIPPRDSASKSRPPRRPSKRNISLFLSSPAVPIPPSHPLSLFLLSDFLKTRLTLIRLFGCVWTGTEGLLGLLSSSWVAAAATLPERQGSNMPKSVGKFIHVSISSPRYP